MSNIMHNNTHTTGMAPSSSLMDAKTQQPRPESVTGLSGSDDVGDVRMAEQQQQQWGQQQVVNPHRPFASGAGQHLSGAGTVPGEQTWGQSGDKWGSNPQEPQTWGQSGDKWGSNPDPMDFVHQPESHSQPTQLGLTGTAPAHVEPTQLGLTGTAPAHVEPTQLGLTGTAPAHVEPTQAGTTIKQITTTTTTQTWGQSGDKWGSNPDSIEAHPDSTLEVHHQRMPKADFNNQSTSEIREWASKAKAGELEGPCPVEPISAQPPISSSTTVLPESHQLGLTAEQNLPINHPHMSVFDEAAKKASGVHARAEERHREEEEVHESAELEHKRLEAKHKKEEVKHQKEYEKHIKEQEKQQKLVEKHTEEMERHKQEAEKHERELELAKNMKAMELRMKESERDMKEEHREIKEEARQMPGGSGVKGGLKDVAHKAAVAIGLAK